MKYNPFRNYVLQHQESLYVCSYNILAVTMASKQIHYILNACSVGVYCVTTKEQI